MHIALSDLALGTRREWIFVSQTFFNNYSPKELYFIKFYFEAKK